MWAGVLGLESSELSPIVWCKFLNITDRSLGGLIET